MDPQCNCEKQEYQDFHSYNNSDLQHQHDQCKCWSIAKRDDSQVGMKHSYSPFGYKITCLGPNTPNQSLFKISKLQNYPELKNNVIHSTKVISKLKTLYSWRK